MTGPKCSIWLSQLEPELRALIHQLGAIYHTGLVMAMLEKNYLVSLQLDFALFSLQKGHRHNHLVTFIVYQLYAEHYGRCFVYNTSVDTIRKSLLLFPVFQSEKN